MAKICAITVLLVLSVLSKTADGRKLIPRLLAQKTTCGSFFYNSQVNNDQGWKTVPEECVDGVGAYMEGSQFQADASGVSTAAEAYLTSITPTGDGKDIVVFDIDETALSNLPYYRQHKYGGEAFNSTPFDLWVEEGTAPAVPATLELFNTLIAAKFGVVFLTGRSESQREITVTNLYRAGYTNWTELILKSPEESGTTAVVYKSKKRTELAEKGYHIYSSVGDQWSDITGPYVGNRTFKVPNPMYFIA
ncbi:hypothetical protein M758_2G085800 [Ceratodon purpureus]|nr:hypothetical protein M758_2G085800 [Ceratodon purpureus]KAG0625875.1 hypothetical protein M758_2G085800 [Ceratodon purpureus]